jgi:hypothetical protein
VVCGHTHKHRYDAPAEDRPYAQLIGGGPQLESATLIRGRATPRELEVTCTNLAGEVLGSWVLAPRA